jgi:antitoxin (DNA-binding transcriptional repressor) of toxin-antitoxin stability system
MAVRIVDVRQASQQLSELLNEAAGGTEVLITDGEHRRVRLVPVDPVQRRRRIPDLHPGSMIMSDDFDEPLGDDFWLGDHDPLLDSL